MMPEDQEIREVSTEKLFHSMGTLLTGIGNVVETVERLLTSLNGIARNIQSMEEDGSLSRLLELLQSTEQQTAHTDRPHRERRSRRDDDED
jgi:hypothetical protein